MKQRGVGEYTIEIVIRQIELEKILLPYFAVAVGTRHVGKMCGAFQADCDVTEVGNHFEVSPGPAAKIKYYETRLTLDVLQHRRDVLADIVIARACPELFGALVIMCIAARNFERSFQLADHVQVKGASLENGLLHIDLVREIPEAMKPRAIPIASSSKVLEVQPTKLAA